MTGSHIAMSMFATRRDFEEAQAEHSGKKLALYEPHEYQSIRVGHSATVRCAEHYEEGQRGIAKGYDLHTTEVQWYNTDTGVFETQNTRYVPFKLGFATGADYVPNTIPNPAHGAPRPLNHNPKG